MDFKQWMVAGCGLLIAASIAVAGSLGWAAVALALVVLGVDAARDLLVDAKNRDERQAASRISAEFQKLSDRVDSAEAEVRKVRSDGMASAFKR